MSVLCLTLVLLMHFHIHIMLMGDTSQGYLEFRNTYKQNFNGYTHVFEDQLFNGVVNDITGSRIIPEIDMAAAQTESNTISAHRNHRTAS